MSRSLLHVWEGSIEKDKNNTEELLKIAEDIYNTAYARGKASTERPQGEWIKWNFKTFGAMGDWEYKCSNCEKVYDGEYNFCPNCGADMRGDEYRRGGKDGTEDADQ